MRLAIAGVSIFFFLGATQSLYGPLLPALRADFGLGSATVGLVFTAHGVAEFFGVLAPSVLSTHSLLARRSLTAATCLLAVGAMAFAIAHSWPTLLLAVFVFALGFGVHVGRLNALFVTSFGARSGSMSQLINAGFSVGSILGPLAVSYWLQASRSLFFAIGIASALLVPIAWWIDRDYAPRTDNAARARITTSRRNAVVAGFVVVMLLTVGVESCVGGWLTSLALFRGLEPAQAARFTSWFFAGIFLGRVVAALVGRHWNPAATVIAAIVGINALLLIACFESRAPIAFAATGLAVAPIFPATLLWLTRCDPDAHRSSALVIAGAILGSAVFPPLVGTAIDQFGGNATAPATFAIGVCSLLAAVVLHWITHAAPKPSSNH